MDALARRGVVFDQAYTYWPKTRGSFVAIMTGRFASQTGYGKTHPLLLDFNPTLASVLKGAGYETAATVDNPNVAASLGYAKGFDRYRETWEEKALASEMDRTRAITADGVRHLAEAKPDRPFFLWLHYVNPHAPYEPPAPVGHRLPRCRGVARPEARARGRLPRRRPEAVGGPGEEPRVVRRAVRRRDRRRGRGGGEARRRPRRLGGPGPHPRRGQHGPRREPGGARLLLRPRREPLRPVDADPPDRRGTRE